MKKGFVYTLFVLFVISLLTILIVFPLTLHTYRGRGEKIRTDEAFYFLRSVEGDLSRAYNIATKRATVAISNEVMSRGQEINNPKEMIKELLHNGTLNEESSTIMEDSSIKDWIIKVGNLATDSSYNLEIVPIRMNISSGRFPYISLHFVDNITLNDPKSQSLFNHVVSVQKSVNISGTEDPIYFLRTEGEKTRVYKQCPYNFQVLQVGTGTQNKYESTNWTDGWAALFLEDEAVSSTLDRNSKIAIVGNICNYSDSELNYLNDFKGVVSIASANVNDPCGRGIEFSNIISGASNLESSHLKNDQKIVMVGNQVWINNIYDELISRCYFYSDGGPDFFDRFENKLVGSKNGIGSFIDLFELPSEFRKSASALDYVYWNESSSPLKKIMGVSNQENWFRLDETHVNLWGINSLVY